MRLIKYMVGITQAREAKVYRDSEWGEYRVRFYRDGEHQRDADYHTDDKEDALATARLFVTRGYA